ncbi:MAG: BamA/TamA family outer membrane protein [Melioribacteraceae bacterium]|nr:BamA/TamA family outer membrane protein [Melioribacteraceae bacterium]MCF8355056.1 BamA/TamA family outer membrane protein [Melioribacteraceae bacterium]MCF8395647.1 BamA/TamA family outer membrane protein [Melioribacteraceae bacterium]MCF8420274.1 BamA/TamA family outer membrane protein [Melioribacteraceae bacterium]
MTHRIIKILSLLIFLFICSSFSAQTISSININGEFDFSESDYLSWINYPEGTPFTETILDSIKSRISRNLANRGYFNFSFTDEETTISADTQNVSINLTIDEDEPSIINKINLNGIAPEDSLSVIDEFDYLRGRVFNKFEIEETLASILDYYEESAQPFASLKIQSVFIYDDTSGSHFADLNIEIINGERSSIDKVEILGNEKTKDYVIIRELRIDKGEEYSQSKIEDIPKKLNRLRFFEPVNSPAFYFNSKNEGVLQITVQEKQTNNFDGIVGYVPGNDDENGYFTGYVNISLRNLFGTGRAAAVRWQQENRYSQELELKYLEPWVLNYPFNITLGLFQRKQDTTYVQRRIEGSLEFLATEDISAAFLFSTESTIPTVRDDNVFTVFNSTSYTTGFNLKIDTRDDVYAPTEGLFFLSAYKYSNKNINGPKEFITPQTETKINLQRIEVDLSLFYELFRAQVAALGLHGKELRGNLFEISDLYQLGGTNTLRGYREKQFIANRIFWSNLEYRYLLSRRTYAFLFFDAGYYLRSGDAANNILKTDAFKTGYGLGLNLETGLGVLAVSYALAKGDPFNEGKIHFGLVNEF